ncbi:MAG: hypothetical protein KAS32_28070 [Candidatus Peribacteraceae bacterium]|nr:hypothetical protein [Candidatus Peribacteraceae bacterium]
MMEILYKLIISVLIILPLIFKNNIRELLKPKVRYCKQCYYIIYYGGGNPRCKLNVKSVNDTALERIIAYGLCSEKNINNKCTDYSSRCIEDSGNGDGSC